jgi:N-acetylglutamate synthase-like GNAT family acetyltransferase
MNLNDVVISSDKSKLDLNVIHKFLTKSYWAKGRTIEEVKISIEHSDCYGMFYQNKQIGFARIITDYIVFAYLMDVFIIPEYQGNGFSKFLLSHIFKDEKFSRVKKWMLATADAHSLYEKYGFKRVASPEKLMEMKSQSNLSQIIDDFKKKAIKKIDSPNPDTSYHLQELV